MAIKAVVELGVLEVVATGSEFTPAELAAQLPTNNPNAPAMLDRILRLLASHSILICSSSTTVDGKVQRRYGLAPASKLLVPDQNGASLSTLLLLQQSKVFMESWYHLKDAVLQGNGVPFNRAHGMALYDYNAQDACFNVLFDSAMHDHSTVVMKKTLEVYNGFHGLRSVFPGVEHVGGDMFSSVPAGDAIFMKGVLFNWVDGRCLELLRNCWKALPENGKVIAMENIVPEIIESSSVSSSVFQFDLLMLTFTGGKSRTEKELEVLAKAAGFTGIKPMCSVLHFWVIEFYKGSMMKQQ